MTGTTPRTGGFPQPDRTSEPDSIMAQRVVYGALSTTTRVRHACPLCALDLVRIPRRPLDRIASLFSPQHRYRCLSHACQWEGTMPVRRLTTDGSKA